MLSILESDREHVQRHEGDNKAAPGSQPAPSGRPGGGNPCRRNADGLALQHLTGGHRPRGALVTGFSSVELKREALVHTNIFEISFWCCPLSDRLRHETRSAAGEHIDCCIDRVWEIMGDMVRDFWMLLRVPPLQSCRTLQTFTINPQLTYTISPCSTFSIYRISAIR